MKNDNYNNFASTFAKSRKNMAWGELDAILSDIAENNFTKILDVGCGSGRFLEFFCKNFSQMPEYYLWVDNSDLIIAEAKKSFPDANFFVSEMQNLDENTLKNFPKFDAIVLLASFHHLDSLSDRKKVLKNLQKLLASNGRIYITNWNLLEQPKYKNSEKSPQEFFIKIGDFVRYYHGFRKEELEELFSENGFSIIFHEVFEGGRNFLSILENNV